MSRIATESTFNALIRTHHITSKRKIAKLKHAADAYQVHAIVHSGRCPGIMYCEGSETGVKSWVNTVQNLRYKDYQLVSRPAQTSNQVEDCNRGRLIEVASVADFGSHMQLRGILSWWRKAMGYT